MSIQIKNKACPDTRSFGGLLAFLGIRALLQSMYTPDQNPRLLLELQAGQPTGLNLHFNPPTVFPQGQSGYAHKAVALLFGASRFCVLRLVKPYARGKPRAPS